MSTTKHFRINMSPINRKGPFDLINIVFIIIILKMEELMKISFDKIIEITPFDDAVVKHLHIPSIMELVDTNLAIIDNRI